MEGLNGFYGVHFMYHFLLRAAFLSIALLFWVAPSTASDVVKDFGATPNDSSDDAPAFVNAMASNAKQLRVPAGQYVLRNLAPYIQVRSDIDILCDDGAVFFVPQDAKMTGGMTASGYSFNPVFGASDADPVITNFTMSGCKFVVEKNGATPLLIARQNGQAIEIRRVVIDGKGSLSHNMAAYGIVVDNGTAVVVSETQVSYVQHGSIILRLPRRCLIDSNKVRFSGVDAGYPFQNPSVAVLDRDYWNTAGISGIAASGCRITNNHIDQTGGVGIIMRGGTGSTENNYIGGNRLTNIGKGGIGIGINTDGTGNSTDNIIENNFILGYMQRFTDVAINVNHRGHGDVKNLVIRNNVIDLFAPGADASSYPNYTAYQETAGVMILIQTEASSPADNIKIEHNTMRNAIGPAIWGTSLRNSVIANNLFANVLRAKSSGVDFLRPLVPRAVIGIDVGYNVNVSDNVIQSCWKPIEIVAIQGSGNTLSGNIVANCGADIQQAPLPPPVGLQVK